MTNAFIEAAKQRGYFQKGSFKQLPTRGSEEHAQIMRVMQGGRMVTGAVNEKRSKTMHEHCNFQDRPPRGEQCVLVKSKFHKASHENCKDKKAAGSYSGKGRRCVLKRQKMKGG